MSKLDLGLLHVVLLHGIFKEEESDLNMYCYRCSGERFLSSSSALRSKNHRSIKSHLNTNLDFHALCNGHCGRISISKKEKERHVKLVHFKFRN